MHKTILAKKYIFVICTSESTLFLRVPLSLNQRRKIVLVDMYYMMVCFKDAYFAIDISHNFSVDFTCTYRKLDESCFTE